MEAARRPTGMPSSARSTSPGATTTAAGPPLPWRLRDGRRTNSPGLHGHRRPSPAKSWADPTPITTAEHDQLAAALATHRQEIRDVTNDFDPAKLNHVRRLQRRALRRALLDLGLVTMNRRALTLPFTLHKAAKIS